MRKQTKDVDAYYIKELIESKFNIDLTTNTRKREYTYLRFVAFKLTKELTNNSYVSIGYVYDKDHATVMHGVKQFNNHTGMYYFAYYDKAYKELKLKITEKFRPLEFLRLKKIDNIDELRLEYDNKLKDLRDEKDKVIERFTNRKVIAEICNLDDDTFKKLEVRINAFLELNSRKGLCSKTSELQYN